MLWREVLEFEDAMELPPVVADTEPDINAQPKDQTKAIDIKRGDKGAVSTAQHHFANGVQRYSRSAAESDPPSPLLPAPPITTALSPIDEVICSNFTASLAISV